MFSNIALTITGFQSPSSVTFPKTVSTCGAEDEILRSGPFYNPFELGFLRRQNTFSSVVDNLLLTMFTIFSSTRHTDDLISFPY